VLVDLVQDVRRAEEPENAAAGGLQHQSPAPAGCHPQQVIPKCVRVHDRRERLGQKRWRE
jgi:hypothetical protein